jgi:hypothetical protein
LPIALTCAALLLLNINSTAASEITALDDNARSGWDRSEPTLTPALLQSGRFGKLFDTRIDGQAYAQPLVFGSNVIVATETNEVYAIDSSTGVVRWITPLGRPAPCECYVASPLVGVLSTPVIDPETQTIYFVARVCEGLGDDCMSPVPKNPGRLHRRIESMLESVGWPSGAKFLVYALRASDGRLLDGWPVEIAGNASNDSTARFDPRVHLQRPALLLLDGAVYAAFGSFCGGYPFRGWVAGINVKTRRVTLWTDEAKAADKSPQAGIWGAGGLVSDAPGSILLATGDGTLPPRGDGRTRADTLGNSVVRLHVQDDGSLIATDHFTPSNGQYLNDSDNDLGAASPAVLPDMFSASPDRHFLLQVDKLGKLYLLDSMNLGGEAYGPGGVDATIAEAGPFGPTFAHPVAWPGDPAYVYVLSFEDKPGDEKPGLRAFRLETDAAGAVVLHLAAANATSFGWYTGSPIITSDATVAASAIIWMIERDAPTRGASELEAYAAIPDSRNLLRLLWNEPIGSAAKFAVPASDSGRIFVATIDGHVLAFGKR